ncbi:MAG: hypothetical protein EBU90_11575 [Proteobacteria bacterium]|nr:hypothetical protein [Pseudomonadota bacterium]NBP14765.1 hypothetical protein [bacterium]
MSFLKKLNEYVLSVEQDVKVEEEPVADVQNEPDIKPASEPAKVTPEGYTEMVRLLAKALVINVPPDAIDGLFTGQITPENTEAVREGLEELINTSGNYEDNPERAENPNFLKYYNSINENNFYQKFKEIVNIMKKYSNDVDINTK